MRWPSASAILRTIDRPSPRPAPGNVAFDRARPRWNSSKTASRCSCGMPQPVSAISILTFALAPPRPDEHPAGAGVADGVGDDVLQQPVQHGPVGTDDRVARPEAEFQTLLLGDRLEVRFYRGEKLIQRDLGDLRHDHAGVELGNVEQRLQEVADGGQRALDLADQLGGLPRSSAGRTAPRPRDARR